MSWRDRLKQGAYNTPESRQRLTFDFEDVARSGDKSTTAYSFADASGVYVQDNGNQGRKYPIRAFFHGPDCDTEAAAFEDGLFETGPGRLEHPLYGTFDVVPFGTVARRDDLKTAANQAVVEVVLWQTITLVYPTSQADPAAEVDAAIDAYNAASSEAYGDALSASTVSEGVAAQNTFSGLLAQAKAGLSSVAAVTDAARREYETLARTLDSTIETLVGAPVDLAFQAVVLLQAPARTAALISDKLSAYSDLADSIITGYSAAVPSDYDNRSANEFHTADLYASGCVSAAVVAATSAEFSTRSEALAAAENLLAQFDTIQAWRESNLASLGQADTGGGYAALLRAVSLAAGYVVELSFSLAQEKAVVLTSARSVLDLAAELYGATDTAVDYLIKTNALNGDEILELPAGKRVVYYV